MRTSTAPEGKQLNEDLQAYRPKIPDKDLLTSGPCRYDFDGITNAQLTMVRNASGFAADAHADRQARTRRLTPEAEPSGSAALTPRSPTPPVNKTYR
ncbi:hypothetical protein ABZV93_17830 [Actinopolymorpha sp. NPDC004070]|uniref:hypothetical protein n=1 Tax=Actinopolymorpha sp. NPDC004070 TaxID=3154548 RepID=UPI0033A4A09C